MNLAVRDIRHNVGRYVLTCVGLALLLGVVQSMIGIYRGLVVEALSVARVPAADIWVVEAATQGPFAEASRIPGDAREAVARVAGVEQAGALTFQSVEAEHGAARLRLFVIGYEPGRPGEPGGIVAGRGIARARFELVVDRRAGLPVGTQLQLGRNDFTVVGLVANQSASGGDPVAYMTLLDAQKLQFDLQPAAARVQTARGAAHPGTDTVNAIVARVRPGETAEHVAAGIARWKHLRAMTQAEQEALLTHSLVDRARRQIGLFTMTLLTVSGVIIALIVYTMTMDKLKSIATLKLIGARNSTIAGLIVQQALAMGLVGWALGRLLIGAVAEVFPRRVELLAQDSLALAAIVAVVCVLGSAASVRMAVRVDPASALAG